MGLSRIDYLSLPQILLTFKYSNLEIIRKFSHFSSVLLILLWSYGGI